MKAALKNSKSIRILLAINVLIALYTSITFLPIPYGESVRAMNWAFYTFLIAAISLCLGIITAATEAWHRKYNTAIASFLLSIIPIPLAILILKTLMMLKGFQLAS